MYRENYRYYNFFSSFHISISTLKNDMLHVRSKKIVEHWYNFLKIIIDISDDVSQDNHTLHKYSNKSTLFSFTLFTSSTSSNIKEKYI